MFNFLERNPFFLAVGIFVVVAIAGLITILPQFADSARPLVGTKPYSILQLAGEQIYKGENCGGCHSGLIRPFKSETDRYGAYSLSGEYAYDRPFLWGSKRTGPDLHRVGLTISSDWHERHMWDPRSVVPGSIMPAYKHMFTKEADIDTAWAEAFTVLKLFNTPYNKLLMDKKGGEVMVKLPLTVEGGREEALREAKDLVKGLKNKDLAQMINAGKIPQIVAVIAYLNSLK